MLRRTRSNFTKSRPEDVLRSRHCFRADSSLDIAVGLDLTLLPMIRGIEVTVYVSTSLSIDDARRLFEERYNREPLVSLAGIGEHPETRWVRGSNRCVIGLYQQRAGQLIISSVIDNLVRGAAGQAIQNMNLMLGFNEFDAIPVDALSP